MQNFKTWLFYLSTYRVFFHKVELIKNLTNGLVFILEVLNKILFIKHYNDWHTVTDVIIINIKERKLNIETKQGLNIYMYFLP